jgi:hypothetical protein
MGLHRANGDTNIARATRCAHRRPHDLINAVASGSPQNAMTLSWAGRGPTRPVLDNRSHDHRPATSGHREAAARRAGRTPHRAPPGHPQPLRRPRRGGTTRPHYDALYGVDFDPRPEQSGAGSTIAERI